jgi:hypothetical protein
MYIPFLKKKLGAFQLMPHTQTAASYALANLSLYFRNHQISYQQHSLLLPDYF